MASYHFSVKTGKRGKAANHAAYIAREDKHGKDERKFDLIAVEHGNLPPWANDSPTTFWTAADEYERMNGSTYKELEIALPTELSVKQNLELVREFIKKEVGEKPYQVAIHAPLAALGKLNQPHAHIMLSDRKPDGIERTAAQHFKRHNSLTPELGGCKKDSGGKEKSILKEELVSRRRGWAELQNAHLEKHGFAARVDHRSNKDRGIDQDPERHLGNVGVKKMTEDEKTALQAERKVKRTALAKDKPTIENLVPVDPGGSANPS